MIKKLLILYSLILILKCEEKFGLQTEDNVIILKTTSFDEFISKHDMVMVEFCAPSSEYCKKLEPKYSELAKIMADQHNIPVAKVDASIEKELAHKFKIKGYPTFKLFVKGLPISYKGKREIEDMKNFILKKSEDATTKIKSLIELEKLKKENKVLIVFFGEDGNNFENYKLSALNYDNLKFVHIFNPQFFEYYKIKINSVILFKNFDEKENRLEGEFNSEKLMEFIDLNRYPIVMEFDHEIAEKIFSYKESAIFLFQNNKSKFFDIFYEIAKEKRYKINFSTSTVTTGLGGRLAEYIGVKEKDSPCIRLVDFIDQKLQKFKMDDEITKENLNKFIDDFLNRKLNDYLKSEKIPENNDKPVKIVVGKNFEKIVLDNSKDVLIKAYAPWCNHCKTLAPIYDQLGEKLKNNSNIIIAKIDITENEYNGFIIKKYPTIRLYKKGKKSDPIEFEGERNLESLIQFIEKNTDLNMQKNDL